jgi:uncharacterized protein
MRITIKELELGPLHLKGEIPQETLGLTPEEVEVSQPIRVQVQAERHSLGIRVKGNFKVQGKVPCARCLESFEIELSPEFELYYQQHDARHPITGEIELGEKDTEISFFSGEALEMRDIVREQILLSLPMKPVCREECRGLCPNCGGNRNLKACNCEAVLRDPRLQPLLKIQNRITLRKSGSD